MRILQPLCVILLLIATASSNAIIEYSGGPRIHIGSMRVYATVISACSFVAPEFSYYTDDADFFAFRITKAVSFRCSTGGKPHISVTRVNGHDLDGHGPLNYTPPKNTAKINLFF